MDDALAPPIQRELAALDSITQRVNMQSSYDIHTARLKDAIRTEEVAHRKKRSQEKVRHRAEIDAKNDELRKMGEQARALASLAFAADVKLVSNDGVIIPACEAVLVANSPVFERLFAERTAELMHQKSGEVKLEASAAVLQFVVAMMYSPSFASAPSTDECLNACELASSWGLAEVFKSCVSALSGVIGDEASAVLAKADRHLGAEDPSSPFTSGWKELRDDAARALARSMPHGVAHPSFKTLSLDAILETASHVQHEQMDLPALPDEPAGGQYAYGPWTEPMTWLASSLIDTACLASSFRTALLQPNSDLGLSFGVSQRPTRTADKDKLAGVPESLRIFEADCHLSVTGPGDIKDKKRQLRSPLLRASNFLKAQELPDYVGADGKVSVRARVGLSKPQRQTELLNLWLIATEQATSPLAPAELLLCLRACACGFDPASADVDALTPRLAERGLLPSYVGDGATCYKEELQTCLQDALFAELPMKDGSALGKVCRALAGLIARRCSACASDGSLFELDAAAFSMVLAHDDLDVQSESVVLEHLSW